MCTCVQIIALPINVQGKPGEMGQQTLQIQVVNPANTSASGNDNKYSLPLHFQQQVRLQACSCVQMPWNPKRNWVQLVNSYVALSPLGVSVDILATNPEFWENQELCELYMYPGKTHEFYV